MEMDDIAHEELSHEVIIDIDKILDKQKPKPWGLLVFCGSQRCFFYATLTRSGTPSYKRPSLRYLFNAALNFCKAQVLGGETSTQPICPRLILPPTQSTMHVTQVVNGLACFYTDDCQWPFLCNIWTEEIVRLPSGSSFVTSRRPKYYLGFDPIKNIYKILRIFPIDEQYNVCEIMWLDSSLIWRCSPVEVPYPFQTQSFCVNGTLYWIHERERDTESDECTDLIAFDLNKEMFQEVEFPGLLGVEILKCRLIQYKGCLALARAKCDRGLWHLNLWVLQDPKGTKWKKHSMKMESDFNYTILGSLPTGEILFAALNADSYLTRVHSWKPYKNRRDSFLVEKFPASAALVVESPANNSVCVCCIEENFKTMDELLEGMCVGDCLTTLECQSLSIWRLFV